VHVFVCVYACVRVCMCVHTRVSIGNTTFQDLGPEGVLYTHPSSSLCASLHIRVFLSFSLSVSLYFPLSLSLSLSRFLSLFLSLARAHAHVGSFFVFPTLFLFSTLSHPPTHLNTHSRSLYLSLSLSLSVSISLCLHLYPSLCNTDLRTSTVRVYWTQMNTPWYVSNSLFHVCDLFTCDSSTCVTHSDVTHPHVRPIQM